MQKKIISSQVIMYFQTAHGNLPNAREEVFLVEGTPLQTDEFLRRAESL